ncbi:ABC transporter permease [Murdochiella sp. Marseille-P8839]|nr:ABC transporter permease [Murdochiella sp. Marseille-P8839]
MKKLMQKNEFFVFVTLLVLCLVIGFINPVFFTAANFVSLLKNSIIMGIMSFALMLGIIAGGIDVSFPSIAVCSMYLTSKLMQQISYTGPVVLPILMAVAIGTILGFINGVIIVRFRLPAFIVTLGTSSLFYGLLVTLVGSKPVNRLVPPMEQFGKAVMLQVTSGPTTATLSYTFLFMIGVALLVYFILNHTMLGRSIYAVGGDPVSAERVGINVNWTLIFVYTFIGAAAGLAGISHTMQARMTQPTDLIGCEMLCIAAVVLGGTNISGGKGTVLGTVLGLALLTVAQNSLILVGITSTWQSLVVGIIIVAGTALSAYKELRNSRKNPKILVEEDQEVLHAAD